MSIKNKLTLTAAISAMMVLPACSTIVNGKNQLVKFNTGSVTGADCTITGGSHNAVHEEFVSPAEVKIPRSKKAIDLACSKTGYADASKTIHSKVEGSTAGNILAGGVIGVGVDALTGALHKYPDLVTIVMTKAAIVTP